MQRRLAARLATTFLAATLALLGSAPLGAASLGADAMSAASLGRQASVGGSASAMGVASQALGWAGSSSKASASAAVAPTSTVTPAPAQRPAPAWWSRYHGVNHVWMPTLGLSQGVAFYACSRSTYPGNTVYRWGCGGRNNVYLFGHNYGVFYPLFQAWRSGTLRVGAPVVYADASGHTRLYRVVTWRVVSPTNSAWAIASQPVPSMTLQTCTNLAGTYRLVVRLVAVPS